MAPTFSNAERVTISGYTGPEQDPTITPDGRWLFFDNHTDSSPECRAFYARWVDYKTFEFMGEIGGLNVPGKKAANANMDVNGNLYWMTDAYYDATANTAYCGVWTEGVVAVAKISQVMGVSRYQPPWLILGPEINASGNQLYFADYQLNPFTGGPASSKIIAANKNPDGSFTKIGGSLLNRVNATGNVLYAAYQSFDGLLLVFTSWNAVSGRFTIYLSSRSNTSSNWGAPARVRAAEGYCESGGFSPDGRRLYYHRLDPDPENAKIYVLTRQ